MEIELPPDWKDILQAEVNKPYFYTLLENITTAYQNSTIYPTEQNIFNAFKHCPYVKVKVVILGQDPYHGKGQAHGLAFSVPEGVPAPPSLHNIYKEILNDISVTPALSGNLTRWTTQGVLLLNATLTVEAGIAGSHQSLGWEQFTDAVIKTISDEKINVVFLLWGAYAQSKQTLIDEAKHLVLTTSHPSPLSAYRGFFGCKHFSQTNTYLIKHGLLPIIW